MRLFKKVVEIAKHPRPFRRLLASLNNSPFRHLFNWLAYLQLRKQHLIRVELASNLKLSKEELAVVRELRENGYARLTGVLNLSGFDKLGEYGDWAADNVEHFRMKNGPIRKSFWTELVEKENGRFNVPTSHPLARFVFQDSLIKIASVYFGSYPTLNYCLLTLSESTKEPLGYSQLWHVDRDSMRVLKIFVYLTNVETTEDGPFTFVDAKVSKKVRNSFFLRHLPDEDFFRSVRKADVRQILGKRYEVFALDTTRCYHMGSRVAEGHRRLMYTGLYVPFISPYFATPEDPHFKIEADLDPQEQMLFRSLSKSTT